MCWCGLLDDLESCCLGACASLVEIDVDSAMRDFLDL